MISPEPFDWFSWYFTHMFLLVRLCAEHMTQLPRLKVTGQGQMIYSWISCPSHISWTIEAIFIKLHPNIPLIEIMCRTYDSATQTQGQGHNLRWDLPFNLCLLHIWPYLLNRLNLFHYTSFKCSSYWDSVQNLWLSYNDSRSRSQFKVICFTLEFCDCSMSPEPFERFL